MRAVLQKMFLKLTINRNNKIRIRTRGETFQEHDRTVVIFIM